MATLQISTRSSQLGVVLTSNEQFVKPWDGELSGGEVSLKQPLGGMMLGSGSSQTETGKKEGDIDAKRRTDKHDMIQKIYI